MTRSLGLIKKSNWETIKQLHLTKNIPMDYEEYDKYYAVFIIWNTTKFTTNIFKPGNKEVIGKDPDNDQNYIEFIQNYKPKIDSNPPDSNPVNIAGVSRTGTKLKIHESSRPDTPDKELVSCWAGVGDDIVNHIIWGGDKAIIESEVGIPTKSVDIKFDPLFGEVWIHEGYAMWENAQIGDSVSVHVIAPPASLQTSINLDLVITGNRVIYSPLGPGTGTHGFADTPAPVFVNSNNGDWDIVDGNLVPNFNGTGKYCIFTEEKTVSRFIEKVPVAGTTYSYVMLQSADSAKLVYPFYLRFIANNFSNSNWKIWFFMTVYRENSNYITV